jgi:hypothetical protein
MGQMMKCECGKTFFIEECIDDFSINDYVISDMRYANKINEWKAFIKDYYINNPDKIKPAEELGILILRLVPLIDTVLLANDFADALSEFKKTCLKEI